MDDKTVFEMNLTQINTTVNPMYQYKNKQTIEKMFDLIWYQRNVD